MAVEKCSGKEPVTVNEKQQPSCFGDPNQVCPRDSNGLIEPQAECLSCGHIKACLQKALREQGVLGESEEERSAASRLTRFFKRWSDQKLGRSKDCGSRS